MTRERIVDRIKKMISLKNDKAATQNEVETAAALIQKLLIEHNLTMGEVNTTEAEEKYDKFCFSPEQKKMEGKWILHLYNMMAKQNFCQTVVDPKWDNPNDRKHKSFNIYIIGKSSDVEVVEYFCSWLVPVIRNMANGAWNSYQGPEKRGRFLRGYLMGCVLGINSKLTDEKQRIVQTSEKSRALIIKRDAQLVEAVSKIFPNLGRTRGSRSSSMDGQAKGFSDGKGMNLRKGVETRGRKLLGG